MSRISNQVTQRAVHGLPKVGRRTSQGLRALLFVVICVVLGRLHELTPITEVLPIGKVLLPLGWIAVLGQGDLNRRLKVLRTTQARMFGLLVLGMALSVPFSLWPGGSVQQLVSFAKGGILFILLVAIACGDERDLFHVARAVVVTGAVLGIVLVAGLGASGGGRATVGSSYDPNDIAVVGVVVLPLAVWALRGPSATWRWVGVAGAAGAMATILKSGSRGGALGLGAVLFLLATVFHRHIPRRWKFGSILLFVGMFALAPPAFWERLQTLRDPSADYNMNSESGRIEVWKRGLGYFASRPLTGVGLGQFGTAEGEWAQRTLGRTVFKWSTAHSIWIVVLAELGVTGFVGFLGLYLPTLRDIRRSRRRAGNRLAPDNELRSLGVALGISIVGFFVTGTFLSVAYSPAAMLLAAMGMSYSNLVKSVSPSQTQLRVRGRDARSGVGPADRSPTIGHLAPSWRRSVTPPLP